jgi:hypothetical protein
MRWKLEHDGYDGWKNGEAVGTGRARRSYAVRPTYRCWRLPTWWIIGSSYRFAALVGGCRRGRGYQTRIPCTPRRIAVPGRHERSDGEGRHGR